MSLNNSKPQNKRPAAPAVYRPQPVPLVLQKKSQAVQRPNIARQPVGPHAMQSPQKNLVQAKGLQHNVPKAPPVYRPQTTQKVLQTKQSRAATNPIVKDVKSKGLSIRNPRAPVTGGGQVVQPALWALGAVGLFGLGMYAVRSWNQFTSDLGDAAGKGLALGAEMAINEMDPFPHPIFRNQQAADYQNERGGFLHHQQQTQHLPEPDRAYIVTFQDEPGKFREKVLSKQKFLWAYTVDERLSIGSPKDNKHAVVAGGKNVYAAGTGHLKTSKQEQDWLAYQYLVQKRDELRQQGFNTPFSNPYIGMAEERRVERPAKGFCRDDIVVLDLDSGHYHPSQAWRKAKIAWGEAGFFVEISAEARHV